MMGEHAGEGKRAFLYSRKTAQPFQTARPPSVLRQGSGNEAFLWHRLWRQAYGLVCKADCLGIRRAVGKA